MKLVRPGRSETWMDGRYLRLDTTNDPLTGDLNLGVHDITAGNLSGTNTGDQDLSGYLLNTTDIFTGTLTLNGVLNTTMPNGGGQIANFRATGGGDDITMRYGYTGYGWYWLYEGSGSGNNNKHKLFSEGSGGVDKQVYEVTQDGIMVMAENFLTSKNITATGTVLGSNLSGTNTGDQDLTPYSKKDGSVDFTSEPNIYEELTAGESLVAGNVCYLKSDGKYWKSQGDVESEVKSEIVLCTETITADSTGTFLIRGKYTDSGLTIGVPYFISPTTAGAKSTTAPTSGNFAKILGWARSATIFYFNPSRDYIEVA